MKCRFKKDCVPNNFNGRRDIVFDIPDGEWNDDSEIVIIKFGWVFKRFYKWRFEIVETA